MLVTNFNVKYVLYKVVCAFYQLADVGLIHPMRERSIRALNRTVDYIEESMPDALGFENQRELTAYALKAAEVDGHYLEFGVFAGGTMRVGEALANQAGVISIIGGGDTAAALAHAPWANKFTHISTGGGATLEFLEGRELPGVKALEV